MRSFQNIIFTGGGSGGHVVPALTLIKTLKKSADINIFYVGGIMTVERELVESAGISYYGIQTGKLRRYFSIENMIDFYRFVFGIFQALIYLLKFNRNKTLIFSTGGFVSLPLVVAAGILGFKVYIHEQTSRIGLANKIASYFAEKIFISFEDSKDYLPVKKTIYSGYPLQENCFSKKNEKFLFNGICLANQQLPIVLVTGGGNGAKILNDFVLRQPKDIRDNYFIIHQVGQRFVKDFASMKSDCYHPVAFIDDLIEVMKHSKMVISRSGAGTVMELIALNKPSIFIPLKIAQKNEQYHNAIEAQKRIGSLVIKEDDINNYCINELFNKCESIGVVDGPSPLNGVDVIIKELVK